MQINFGFNNLTLTPGDEKRIRTTLRQAITLLNEPAKADVTFKVKQEKYRGLTEFLGLRGETPTQRKISVARTADLPVSAETARRLKCNPPPAEPYLPTVGLEVRGAKAHIAVLNTDSDKMPTLMMRLRKGDNKMATFDCADLSDKTKKLLTKLNQKMSAYRASRTDSPKRTIPVSTIVRRIMSKILDPISEFHPDGLRPGQTHVLTWNRPGAEQQTSIVSVEQLLNGSNKPAWVIATEALPGKPRKTIQFYETGHGDYPVLYASGGVFKKPNPVLKIRRKQADELKARIEASKI